MFWRKCSQETIDARVLEAARKNLRHVKRWGRWWKIVFFVTALALCVGLAIVVGKLVQGFANNPPPNRLELWFGLILGMLLGGALHRVIGGMIELSRSLLPDDRDRLLVRYHDALREVLDGSTRQAAEIEGDHGEDAPDGDLERQAPFNRGG